MNMRAVSPSLLALTFLLSGCAADVTDVSTTALTVSNENLAQRQAQSRRFGTKDTEQVLKASAGVVQDLGFLIQETSAKAGVITADKDRDAMETGQVAGQVFLALLIASVGGRSDPTWDQTQKIRASIVTQLSADGAGTLVRVNFQRVVWDNKNNISKIETISEPAIYQQFFEKLSQSLFLEAHRI